MKKLMTGLLILTISLTSPAQQKSVDQRVDSVLQLMTLTEKIGQLNQYSDDGAATGPVTVEDDKVSQVRYGQLGSLLNCKGAERTASWQKIAMQSRLKIPLLFGLDIKQHSPFLWQKHAAGTLKR
jgi:beta-glucosidase